MRCVSARQKCEREERNRPQLRKGSREARAKENKQENVSEKQRDQSKLCLLTVNESFVTTLC